MIARSKDARTERTPTVSTWHRYAWIFGLVVLAGVTAHGLHQFVTGDWASARDYWKTKLFLLPVIVGLAMLDVFLEGVSWVWVTERFGLRTLDAEGLRVYMAGNAGKVMPAQLGRLIRPEALVRLGRGTPSQCLKAEAAIFVFDTLSVGALLAGLAAFLVHPLLGPVAAATVIVVALLVGSRIANLLSDTPLDMPKGFWLSWQSLSVVGIQMAGWIAHGLAFYVLVADLPGDMGLWECLFMAPGAAVLGVGSGMPGGVGATEGLLGLSLKTHNVPSEHFAVVVAAFRLVTFWIWVAVGWAFLISIRYRAKERAREPTGLPEPTQAVE